MTTEQGIYPLPPGAVETIEYELGDHIGAEFLKSGLQGFGPDTYQPLYDIAMEMLVDEALGNASNINPANTPGGQQRACERVAYALAILIEGK